MDDAVRALANSIKRWYISEGGGMTFARASNNLYDTSIKVTDKIKGYNLVIDSLLSPFSSIM